METSTALAESYQADWESDQGRGLGAIRPMAKVRRPEMALEAAPEAQRIPGGYGYPRDG